MLFVFLVAASAYAQGRADDAPEIVSVLVPVVGSVNGINDVRWKTDIILSNDTGHEITVGLSLPTTTAPAIIFPIPPASTQRFTDIVGQAFGLETALSPLQVTTLGRRSVRIEASVYGVRGTEIFPPEPIAVSYGETYFPLRALSGLSFSDAFRTNVGIANLGEHDASFTLALQRVAGRNVAVTRITIAPNELMHTSIQSLFPLITKGDDFTVLVETSSPDTYIYASVIDNQTNETHFVQPSVASPDTPQTAATEHSQ